MSVNARTEEFQHFELFDKFALFTNARIDRSTVPDGWYCYDFRGSDDDPGELCYIERSVVVNHAGSVLMPEKLEFPASGRLDARDEFGFLDEGDMILREFCEIHELPYPAEEEKYHIRPARPDEAGLFYTPHPSEDERLGAIGHVRMDFGRSGNEFWHTWWPRGPEELNSPVFKAELQEVVDTLRENVLKSRFAMERFCYEHGGKIVGGYVQNYGYIVETEHYRYCLRCNPSPGDYNGYLTAYDLDVQRQNMARDKPLAGRVTYANGDAQDFAGIGRMMRHGENGVFVNSLYVLRDGELTAAQPCAKGLPSKPSYLFRLTLGLHPDFKVVRTVTLDLPATEAELSAVQEQLGTLNWENTVVLNYDGILPNAAFFADLPSELETFNEFAKAVQDMSTAPTTASAFLNTPAHSTPKFLAERSARPSTVSMKMWYCPLSLKCSKPLQNMPSMTEPSLSVWCRKRSPASRRQRSGSSGHALPQQSREFPSWKSCSAKSMRTTF